MDLIDFRNHVEMDRLRRKMGAEYVEWSWKAPPSPSPILKKLSSESGIELGKDLSDLGIEGDDTFSYQGERVLLYIRDQHYYPDDPDREYKYHISACRTIKDMFNSGRKNRYVVTKNTSETFEVRVTDQSGEVQYEGPREMRVCKNCLQNLNYKGYGRHGTSTAKTVYRQFSLEEFFEIYGETHFHEKPDYTEYTSPVNEYADNFNDISTRYRRSQDWTCEECDLDLSDDRQWLHTHHKDHIKSNNSRSNLKALCLRCHAEIHPQLKNMPQYRQFTLSY
jgi:hypothetical protein